MINIMNGRVKYNGYINAIDFFLVEGDGETALFKIDDHPNFKVVDKVSFSADQNETWEKGGAWTSYNIDIIKSVMFKANIKKITPEGESVGQFYFAALPVKKGKDGKYVRGYTTDIIHKKGTIFENKKSVVMLGSCTYLPEQYLKSRGVNYNERLCNDRNFQQLINKIKII